MPVPIARAGSLPGAGTSRSGREAERRLSRSWAQVAGQAREPPARGTRLRGNLPRSQDCSEQALLLSSLPSTFSRSAGHLKDRLTPRTEPKRLSPTLPERLDRAFDRTQASIIRKRSRAR